MRRAVLTVVIGLLLSGCLEEVDSMGSPGSVTLTWQPPTANTDGTPLMNLAGYTIYVGTNPGNYEYREIRLDNPGLTVYVIDNLEPGTYYLAATAFNSSGIESDYSGEIVRTVN